MVATDRHILYESESLLLRVTREEIRTLAPGIGQLAHRIRQETGADDVWLYGSRARGDHRADSDFDLCAVNVTDEEAWSDLIVEIAYEPPILLPIDLVRIDRVPDELAHNIFHEGVSVV